MADGVTLGALLPNRLDSMADRIKDRLCDNQEIGGMKLAWGFVGKEIHDALKGVLDCDLLEILAQSWARSGALSGLADPAKHPAGERSVIEVGEHELKRELHPTIAVTIGSCPCVELKFTFAVTAKIGGARLSIVDGHIVGGDLGEAWASAQLSYDGVPLHSAAESSKVTLAGEFRLAPPGVAIPLLAVARPEPAGGAGAI